MDTIAAGSPATNEYRPHRSERSTLSRSTPGPSPASEGNTPTGVDTSEESSAHTGTSGHSRASAANSSFAGWIRSPSIGLLLSVPPGKRESPGMLPGPAVSCQVDQQRTRGGAGWSHHRVERHMPREDVIVDEIVRARPDSVNDRRLSCPDDAASQAIRGLPRLVPGGGEAGRSGRKLAGPGHDGDQALRVRHVGGHPEGGGRPHQGHRPP